MIWKAVLFLLVSAVLHFVARSLSAKLPRAAPVDIAAWPPEMVQRVARRTRLIGDAFSYVLFFVLAPLWIGGAYWLDRSLLPELGPGEFLAQPIQWGRWIRGCVGAAILAGLLAMWIFRRIVGWRFDYMVAAGSRQYGEWIFFYWAFVWLLPFCIEYEFHSLGYSAYFAPDALYIRQSMLLPAQTHDYRELVTLELAKPYPRPQPIGASPELRLQFQDGYIFTDGFWWSPWDRIELQDWSDVAKFVSGKSGQPTRVVAKIQ